MTSDATAADGTLMDDRYSACFSCRAEKAQVVATKDTQGPKMSQSLGPKVLKQKSNTPCVMNELLHHVHL
jgi:hypothetical protein